MLLLLQLLQEGPGGGSYDSNRSLLRLRLRLLLLLLLLLLVGSAASAAVSSSSEASTAATASCSALLTVRALRAGAIEAVIGTVGLTLRVALAWLSRSRAIHEATMQEVDLLSLLLARSLLLLRHLLLLLDVLVSSTAAATSATYTTSSSTSSTVAVECTTPTALQRRGSGSLVVAPAVRHGETAVGVKGGDGRVERLARLGSLGVRDDLLVGQVEDGG